MEISGSFRYLYSQMVKVIPFLCLLIGLSGCTLDASLFYNKDLASIVEEPATPVDPSPTTPTTPEVSFGQNGLLKFRFGANKNTTDSDISGMAIQADGKIVFTGYISTYSDADFGLVRLNVDGTLDSSFGQGGIVTWDSGVETDEYSYGVAIQPDQKIVVVGHCSDPITWLDSNCVVRFNSDGSVDSTFGNNGRVIITPASNNTYGAYKVAVLANSKIIFAAQNLISMKSQIAVYRLNTDGSMDLTFNGGQGLNQLSLPNGNSIKDLVIDDSGYIWVAGDMSGQSLVVKFSSNGSLDTSFGGTGIVISDRSTGADQIKKIFPQADGTAYVVGDYWAGNQDLYISKYLADGSIDMSYNGTGISLIDLGGNEYARSAVLHPNGSFYIFLQLNSNYAAIKVFLNGAVDSAFGTSGVVTTDLSGNVDYDIPFTSALQADGKMVVAGYSYMSSATQDDYSAVRYNTDGTLDTTFAGDGTWIHDIYLDNPDSPSSLDVDEAGNIFIAGSSTGDVNSYIAVKKISEAGTDLSSFGTNSISLQEPYSYSTWQVVKVKSLPSGKILVGGSGKYDFFLARLNSDGSLDTSFAGGAGYIRTDVDPGNSDWAHDMVIQSDGKVVLVGQSFTKLALVRYNSDGTLDTTYGSSGKVLVAIGGSANCTSATLLPGDKILCSGDSDNDFLLTRFDSNGSLDASFAGSGYLLTDFSGNGDSESSPKMALQSDGKIVLAGPHLVGGAEWHMGIIRYNSDGSLDTTFNGTGKLIYAHSSGSQEYISDVSIQSDGKILIAGSVKLSSIDNYMVMRLNIDGSTDTTFGTSGFVIGLVDNESVDNLATDIFLRSDDSFYLLVRQSKRYSMGAIYRFKKDGTL